MGPSLAIADLKTNRLLKKVTLPLGFKIQLYAEDVPNARSMTLSPNGILFVGTRKKGNVYAVIDNDQDQKADQVVTIASDLNMPNGVAFRDGHLYVAEYRHQIFIAEHGSWNRSKKIGYRVSLVTLENNHAIGYTPFARGWKIEEGFWGRPVDLLVMPDGALLISDDYRGAIYRVSYAE